MYLYHQTSRISHLCLEESAVIEKLFHRHVGHDGAGLALNNALDDVLYVVTTRGDDASASLADLAIRIASKEHGIFLQ